MCPGCAFRRTAIEHKPPLSVATTAATQITNLVLEFLLPIHSARAGLIAQFGKLSRLRV